MEFLLSKRLTLKTRLTKQNILDRLAILDSKGNGGNLFIYSDAPYHKNYRVKVKENSFELKMANKPRYVILNSIKGQIFEETEISKIMIQVKADSNIEFGLTLLFGIVLGIATLTSIQILIDDFHFLYLVPHLVLFIWIIFMSISLSNEYSTNKKMLTKIFDAE